MLFPIKPGLLTTTLSMKENGLADLAMPVSGSRPAGGLAAASALQDVRTNSDLRVNLMFQDPAHLLETRFQPDHFHLQKHRTPTRELLAQRLNRLGLIGMSGFAVRPSDRIDLHSAFHSSPSVVGKTVAHDAHDLARLAAALDVLEEENDVQAGAILRMAVTLGDKHSFDALLTLSDLQIVDLDALFHDGSTLLHTMAWHGVEDPLLMEMPFMLEPMPARDQFADMPEEYLSLAQRIAALSDAGADMNSSIAELRQRFRHSLERQGLGEEAVLAELRQRATEDAQRLVMLRQRPHPSAQDVLEVTWRSLREHASPLMCALFDMQRDASKIVAVEALLQHGADPDRRFEDQALSTWLAQHKLPAFPTIPVHAAARHLPVEALQAFLDADANLLARGERGETVLHWAALNEDHPEVMAALLASDAALLLEARTHGDETPLQLASAQAGNDLVVKLLHKTLFDE